MRHLAMGFVQSASQKSGNQKALYLVVREKSSGSSENVPVQLRPSHQARNAAIDHVEELRVSLRPAAESFITSEGFKRSITHKKKKGEFDLKWAKVDYIDQLEDKIK